MVPLIQPSTGNLPPPIICYTGRANTVHPFKKGIPTGKFMRAKRNCSTAVAFQNESLQLIEQFSRRGDNLNDLKSYEKVSTVPRDTFTWTKMGQD